MECTCTENNTCMDTLRNTYSLNELTTAFTNLQSSNPTSSINTWALQEFISRLTGNMRSKTLSSSGELLFKKFVIELTNINK